jgi:hypothetical protein
MSPSHFSNSQPPTLASSQLTPCGIKTRTLNPAEKGILTCHTTTPSFHITPSWAGVVQGELRASLAPPPSAATAITADFISVYEHCTSSGLCAHVAISNNAGYPEVSIFCRLPTPAATAAVSTGHQCHLH